MFEHRGGRLIFLPKDMSQEELPIKVIELEEELSLHQQNSSTEKFLDIAAEKIREEVKSTKSKLI